MNEKETKRISKFMSLILRHEPQKIGIKLDSAGWVDVDQFLSAMKRHGKKIDRDVLNYVVESNDKQRFSFSEDGTRIRATQGHSVKVDLGYQPAEPPEILFHGTPTKFVETIRGTGLKKVGRHHVHLHHDQKLATQVGGRRGKPVLLKVWAKKMFDANFEFFVTENQVWLTDHVPAEFIEFPPKNKPKNDQ